jgi:hypothetical protein
MLANNDDLRKELVNFEKLNKTSTEDSHILSRGYSRMLE